MAGLRRDLVAGLGVSKVAAKSVCVGLDTVQ